MGGKKPGRYGRRPYKGHGHENIVSGPDNAKIFLRPKNTHISHDIGRRINPECLDPWQRFLEYVGDVILRGSLGGKVVMAARPTDLYVSLTMNNQIQVASKKSDPLSSGLALNQMFDRLETSRKLHTVPVKLKNLFFKHGERPHRDNRHLVAVVEANILEANLRDIACALGTLPDVPAYSGAFKRSVSIPIARFTQPPPSSFISDIHGLQIPSLPRRGEIMSLNFMEVIDLNLIEDRQLEG